MYPSLILLAAISINTNGHTTERHLTIILFLLGGNVSIQEVGSKDAIDTTVLVANVGQYHSIPLTKEAYGECKPFATPSEVKLNEILWKRICFFE
jgi:hypothetical protein